MKPEGSVTRLYNLADSRLKGSQIVEIVGILKDHMASIRYELLDMRKLSAQWVP